MTSDLLMTETRQVGDPLAISVRCPHCQHIGIFQGYYGTTDLAWKVQEAASGDGDLANLAKSLAVKIDVWMRAGIRFCPNKACNGVVFVLLKDAALLRTYPGERIDFDSSKLPPKILSSLEEAINCHSVGAYRAASLMVRRTLEDLCENRNAKGGDLKARLMSLGRQTLVPVDLMSAADELRILGNDAAHVEAKNYDKISKNESTLSIELAKELLKATYQYGDLLGRLRALKKDA